jgi:hypothetical protein
MQIVYGACDCNTIPTALQHNRVVVVVAKAVFLKFVFFFTMNKIPSTHASLFYLGVKLGCQESTFPKTNSSYLKTRTRKSSTQSHSIIYSTYASMKRRLDGLTNGLMGAPPMYENFFATSLTMVRIILITHVKL